MRDCKKCLWYEDCTERVPCEHYYDGSMDGDIEAYEQDLRMRANTHAEVMNDIRS